MPPCVAGQAGKAHGERIEERRRRRGSPKETCTSRHPRKRVRSQAAAEGVRVGKACTAEIYRRHKEHGRKNNRRQSRRERKNVPNIKANQHLAGTCGTRRKHALARRRNRSSYIYNSKIPYIYSKYTLVTGEYDLPTGLRPDLSPRLKLLGNLVRQHPPIVLQLPEPPKDVGESGTVSDFPIAAAASFCSPLPHERQYLTGVTAEHEPVRGARATGHALLPVYRLRLRRRRRRRRPLGLGSIAFIQEGERCAPGRRAKDVGQPLSGYDECEHACGGWSESKIASGWECDAKMDSRSRAETGPRIYACVLVAPG